MPALAPVLLRLASAIGPDGHEIVPRLLAEALAPHVEFEAGEIVLSHAGRLRRYPLAGPGGPLIGDDFLRHLLHAREPMRIDDPSEAVPFPLTLEIMAARGLQSMLAIPLSAHGAPAGGVVLARGFSWSLVGVSLTMVVPIAAMAGLALERSLGMAALARPSLMPSAPPAPAEPPAPEPEPPAPEPEPPATEPGGPAEGPSDPATRTTGARRRRRR